MSTEATAEDFSDLASAMADTFAMDVVRQHGGVAKAFAAIQSAERERCAKIAAEAFNIGTGHPFDEGVREGCRRAAAAIRNLD